MCAGWQHATDSENIMHLNVKVKYVCAVNTCTIYIIHDVQSESKTIICCTHVKPEYII